MMTVHLIGLDKEGLLQLVADLLLIADGSQECVTIGDDTAECFLLALTDTVDALDQKLAKQGWVDTANEALQLTQDTEVLYAD
jgi:hypothetical protein